MRAAWTTPIKQAALRREKASWGDRIVQACPRTAETVGSRRKSDKGGTTSGRRRAGERCSREGRGRRKGGPARLLRSEGTVGGRSGARSFSRCRYVLRRSSMAGAGPDGRG